VVHCLPLQEPQGPFPGEAVLDREAAHCQVNQDQRALGHGKAGRSLCAFGHPDHYAQRAGNLLHIAAASQEVIAGECVGR
jgi:hypothetical protein